MDQLAQRLARGDETAYAELYDQCALRVHRYLLLRLGNREDAQDALQESFVRLVRARAQLENVQSVVAFVFAIARHEASRLQSRRGRERQRQGPIDLHEFLGPDPPDSLETQENVQVVTQALSRLSEEQREVVVLKIYGDLTFREIAEVTGLPQGTLATRYRAALQRLRDLLAKEHS